LKYDLPIARDFDHTGNVTVSIEPTLTLDWRIPDFVTLETDEAKGFLEYDDDYGDFIYRGGKASSITLKPSLEHAGHWYNFNIVVSEDDATNIRYSYPCTAHVLGVPQSYIFVTYTISVSGVDG